MPTDRVLTLKTLTWKIWWAPNNASRWQMGFNSASKGLTHTCKLKFWIGHHNLHFSNSFQNPEGVPCTLLTRIPRKGLFRHLHELKTKPCSLLTNISQHSAAHMDWLQHVSNQQNMQKRSKRRLLIPVVSKLRSADNVNIQPLLAIWQLLYGCETWSFTLREQRRVRVYENRVLRENIWA